MRGNSVGMKNTEELAKARHPATKHMFGLLGCCHCGFKGSSGCTTGFIILKHTPKLSADNRSLKQQREHSTSTFGWTDSVNLRWDYLFGQTTTWGNKRSRKMVWKWTVHFKPWNFYQYNESMAGWHDVIHTHSPEAESCFSQTACDREFSFFSRLIAIEQ